MWKEYKRRKEKPCLKACIFLALPLALLFSALASKNPLLFSQLFSCCDKSYQAASVMQQTHWNAEKHFPPQSHTYSSKEFKRSFTGKITPAWSRKKKRYSINGQFKLYINSGYSLELSIIHFWCLFKNKISVCLFGFILVF